MFNDCTVDLKIAGTFQLLEYK